MAVSSARLEVSRRLEACQDVDNTQQETDKQAERQSQDSFDKSDNYSDKSVYDQNIVFWENAWNMVKSPYKQLPNLGYLPRIPETFTAQGARKILDFGCGSGWLSVYLARQGFDVIGVDVAAQAIKLAETWALQEDLKIAFDVCDIASLTYADASFDGVVANSIFEHFTLTQAESMTRKVHDMLTPNGVFVGCFDKVGGGPGEYYSLPDGTHVYTDKARKGMLLRRFSQQELTDLFAHFASVEMLPVDNESLLVIARK